MAELVRAVLGDYEKNVGRAYAEAHDLKVLDEPTRTRSGALRPTTRKGRRPKPKTTVSQEAAKKKAAVTESAPAEKE